MQPADAIKDTRAERIEFLRSALQDAADGIEPGTEIMAKPMFGGAGYYAGGLLFAMWYGEGLSLKLAEPDRDILLEIPGAAHSQFGTNVEVPETFLTQIELLLPWVEKCLAYARTNKRSGRPGTPGGRKSKPR